MITHWWLILLMALGQPLASQFAPESQVAHPEAQPFDAKANASNDADAALLRAKASGKMVLVILGANWCHDSRALAGWLAQPRFAAMVASRYELVYVDVGRKNRNLDIARRFGLSKVKGTPTLLILDATGKLLNRKDAPTWRNAASRSEDKIYNALANFKAP